MCLRGPDEILPHQCCRESPSPTWQDSVAYLAAWKIPVLFLELSCSVGPIKTIGIWLLP